MRGDIEAAVKSYFTQLMELRPIDATYFGLHEHDARLPEGGLAGLETELRLLRHLSGQLDSLQGEELELQLARYYTDVSLFQIEEQRTWAGMAEGPEVIGTGIFLLFAREFAPLPQRLAAIASRLEDSPRYLRASRELVEDPVELWNRIALETASHLPELFQAVVESAPEGKLKDRLERGAAAAAQALSEHSAWIEAELLPRSRAEFALGEERFEKLLRVRRLPGSSSSILELGHAFLAEAQEQRRELLARHWPGRSLEAVEAEIKADHAADFAGALEQFRETIAEARRFVIDHGLATIPGTENLQVMATPSFMRPVIPFAAYEPAAYFDERQVGIYVVTPPVDSSSLGEKNRSDILNTSVHEAYPGHHLQFACANLHPSLVRLLAGLNATEFIEGWAHYCEQLMFDEGFSGTPEVRFIQLTDLIWRACRIIIDVELSCGRQPFEEAVRLLTGEAGMSRASAESEVKRYTYTPGYQLSYLYGKHLLMELRERVQRAQGPDFSLRDFHDRLLYAGALPAAFWPHLFPAA